MNIVLIGYRACGKTLIGQRVAERLGWTFVDTDRGIEAHENGRTISAIFAEDGEPYYREVEAAVVREVLARDRQIIAFGGGTIMIPAVQELFDSNTLVVYLEASPDLLWERAGADASTSDTRPNLLGGGKEEIVEMLRRRAPVYVTFATLTLDASRTPDDLVDRILEAVKG
tara:strand:+ start:248 stop:760 length:513 start_codon:yes stop_codon:yes gene_type:complete